MGWPSALVKIKEKPTKQQEKFQELSKIVSQILPSVSKPDKRLWTETSGASIVPSRPRRADEIEVIRSATLLLSFSFLFFIYKDV